MTDVKLPPLPEPAILKANLLANSLAYGFHAVQMEEYARLAVLQERERCAKMCDAIAAKVKLSNGLSAVDASDCAFFIRQGE